MKFADRKRLRLKPIAHNTKLKDIYPIRFETHLLKDAAQDR